MRLKNDYEILASAIIDAEEIVEKLRPLAVAVELDELEVRGLMGQYEWTVISIMRLCNKILDTEPRDCYSKEVDDRIEVEKLLFRYEEIFHSIEKTWTN